MEALWWCPIKKIRFDSQLSTERHARWSSRLCLCSVGQLWPQRVNWNASAMAVFAEMFAAGHLRISRQDCRDEIKAGCRGCVLSLWPEFELCLILLWWQRKLAKAERGRKSHGELNQDIRQEVHQLFSSSLNAGKDTANDEQWWHQWIKDFNT